MMLTLLNKNNGLRNISNGSGFELFFTGHVQTVANKERKTELKRFSDKLNSTRVAL
jgi:hypothetical protein